LPRSWLLAPKLIAPPSPSTMEKKMERKFHWPSFWNGFVEALAIPAVSVVAFAAVWRRALRGDTSDVRRDVRAIWWTHEESEARNQAVFDRIYAELEFEHRDPDKSLN
jgi:hypothetical protein